MLFSVIIPVYNVEKYLRCCVNSVKNQSFTDYELILVNDGSTDNCPEICDEYAFFDERVKVIHKNNEGLSAARNDGLKIAQGEYIVFLDSDDFFEHKDCLKLIAYKTVAKPDLIIYKTSTCDETGNDISYSNINFDFKYDKTEIGKMVETTIIDDGFQASAWSKCIKKSVLIDNDITFEKGLLGEDIDWYLSVIRKVKTFELLDNYIYVYRKRPGSITKTFGVKNLADLIWILQKWNSILQNSKIDNALKHYLGKTYTSLLIVYASVKDNEKKSYKQRIKSMSQLLKYDLNPRTKKINKFYKRFGFGLTVTVLKAMLILKK